MVANYFCQNSMLAVMIAVITIHNYVIVTIVIIITIILIKNSNNNIFFLKKEKKILPTVLKSLWSGLGLNLGPLSFLLSI